MRTLQSLKQKMIDVELDNAKTIQDLESQLITAMKFDKNKTLKKAIAELENSKNLTSHESDEWLYTYTRVYFSEIIDTTCRFEKDALKEYMRENHSMEVDFKNDCLLNSIGPAILINDDGDVLDQDSGKWIIKKCEYSTEEELNELIESHMELNGYFPSVVSCDRHNNFFFVNTAKKKVSNGI